jgi:hypothetical protein
MKFVHVQTVLDKEDIIALKEKSGETTVKDAIAKAIYHYLKCDQKIGEVTEKIEEDEDTM